MTEILTTIPDKVLENYFDALVNKFFKILPIRENEEASLKDYIHSFQIELIGCNTLFQSVDYNYNLMSLIGILQYLHDHDCEVSIVRREVFKAISICKKLKRQYCEGE